ncbi:MAG: DUF1853 family protein [Melioribacteraceae bacterium]|nr:DUF1853 family protein [Melioribacteraceae bacterium]
MKSIKYYKNQTVRDLAWVIGSAPLMLTNNKNDLFLEEDFFINEFKKFIPRLDELDNNPHQLVEHINNGNTYLLGKYFESLVEYWLRFTDDKKLLSHNLQVFKGRNTIGEFDFIFRDLTYNKVYHLECAGKFYIAHKNVSEHSNFIGPNSIDNLDRKISKLVNEQILLGQTKEGKEALLIDDIDEEIIPKIFLKGYLFYNADLFFNNSFIPPHDSNPDHPKGWWIYAKDIEYFLSQRSSKWSVVDRSNWISKVITFNDISVFTNNELTNKLKNYFSKNTYPLLIAELSNIGKNYYEEISRGFIVHDTWPEINL